MAVESMGPANQKELFNLGHFYSGFTVGLNAVLRSAADTASLCIVQQPAYKHSQNISHIISTAGPLCAC